MILLLALAAAPGAADAQAGRGSRDAAAEGWVAGRIVSGGAPVPYARVEVRGSTRGTVADSAGAFLLRLPAGTYELTASALGYGTAAGVVVVGAGEGIRLELEVRPDALRLSPIVVTGTLRETRVEESAVKVDVVTGGYLRRSSTANLMEAIGQVNGLYRQVECGVCYTDNIRINGMEGPYTAVLIDGMPIMSALASVYGLSGINPSLVDRIEVVKGPSSTLYGTEAMAGVVNVVLKDPRFAPRVAVEGQRTSWGRWTVDAAGAPSAGSLSALVSGTLVGADRFLDGNGDGFSDVPLESRGTLFARLDWAPERRRVASVTGKLYREERFGGVEAWTMADRGSDSVYGEWIRTERAELLASVSPSEALRVDLSLSRHDQDSWYGAQRFEARQDVGYAVASWSGALAASHGLLLGASVRAERYDDDTPATAVPEARAIPGVFGQHEARLGPALTLLWGLRLDHHDAHGVIAAPRGSVRWQPGDHTTLRLNTGTGFRVVRVFTEDHAALTGAREVVIAEALRPERSWSLAANANHVIVLRGGEAMVDLDVFHTRFSNRIVADYDRDPDLIVYANLDGHAISRGVSIAVNHVNFDPALSWDFGLTIQDVHVVRAGVRERQTFAPSATGILSGSWRVTGPLTVDYTARVTGPMRLPRYAAPHERPERSPAWSVHNLQATVDLPAGGAVYAGVRNLFDFTQGSPLVDPADPFGAAFDTSYVWGPIRGREIALGVRWGVAR